MEKKNTVLLTVIAVATLLVAVVGATFAYFTATSDVGGAGTGATNVNTTSVADTAELNTTTSTSNSPYYPGTINYASATVSANKKGTVTTATPLNVSYSIDGSVTIPSELGSDVTWTLYKTTSAVSDVVSACGDEKHVGTGTTGDGANGIPVGETRYFQACQKSGSLTDSVKVTDSATSTDGTFSDTGTLATGTGTTGGQTVYYYLVVEYANKSESQNEQQGKTISFQINQATPTGTAS